jgi:membrane-associated phospholipid phosphatase
MARIDDRRDARLKDVHAGPAPVTRVRGEHRVPAPRALRDVASRVQRLAGLIPWGLRQSLIVVGMVTAYFLIRGVTQSATAVAVAHSHQLEDVEDRLGIGVEHQVQSFASRSPALIDVANWIYIWGHWPVIVLTLLWLLLRHRPAYLRLRDSMAVSGALGMAIFVSYPVAPPRLATAGLVDTVMERSSAYRVLQPPIFTDRYAAMPSLHVGWDLLVGMAIVTTAQATLVRLIGWALPPLMAIAVIVTANHSVLDVVVGVLLALGGHLCALALEHRRGRRGPSVVTS